MKRLKKNSPESIRLRIIKIKCLNCKKILNKFRFGNYKEPRKYCCHKCSVEHHKIIRPIGKNHYLWKGEDACYFTRHSWIYNNFGKANKCENNKCDKKCKTFQWANISGEYHRDMNDWKQLCKSCHAKYDHIRLYGDKCKRGHKRPTEEERKDYDGGWKECRQCIKEKYIINRERILKRRRELYALNKKRKSYE
jgi:hypothetical protein